VKVEELATVFEISFMGSQTVAVVSSTDGTTRCSSTVRMVPDVDLMGVTHGSTTVQCGQEFILEYDASGNLKAFQWPLSIINKMYSLASRLC
jgi:hypothetical protein